MTLIKKTFEDFSITEKRLKPITKKHWKKASDDQKEEWLLQAFSDPDDAAEFIEVDWEDLPDVATQNMYENFVDYYLTLNEGKVTKKHIDKKIDEISNLSKELKANFAKYKSAKTEDEKKEFMTIAADLTKKKHAADAELERLIQSFGKDMGLDPNFESVEVNEASKLSAKEFGKWKQEREYVKQMADNNTSTVYKIADYVQFLGLLTQKQWEMFMYGRYEKHLSSKDPKVKNKIYKVLTKWFE